MTSSGTKQITLQDVASASGVSYQTVSRVVNSHPHVSKKTRESILNVIQQLDYRPNRAARSLITRRSNTLGIISFGTGYYGPSQIVANIEGAIESLGYSLTFANIKEPTLEQLQGSISELKDRLVDGIIMITPIVHINVDNVTKLCQDIPFVVVDIELGARIPSAVIDQSYGAELATQHLIDLGHRHIGEISGQLHWCDAKQRHQGWLATLKKAGLVPGPSIEGDWTAAAGYTAAQKLLDQGAGFSALVVGNDQMALGAVRALRERGLRVPEDVSVVGFDDRPEAAYFEPPLTTVHQDFAALGQQSVEYLILLIEKTGTPLHQRVLYPTLTKRLSTTYPRED